MIDYTNVNEYISYLIENQVNVNIIDFVKEINKLKYNIDISFIDEFIELVSKDECCIHHNMLQKYSILKLNKGSNDVKVILEQNNFIENEEYLVRNVPEQLSSGTKYKNEYYLHPEAFKICLMRSKNTKIYAKYYILLEKCIKYFNDYQLELNKKYIIKLKNKIEKKDNKIDKLEEKVNKLLENNEKLLQDNKETRKYNEEIIKRSKKMEYQLNEALEKLDETNNILDNTKEELEETTFIKFSILNFIKVIKQKIKFYKKFYFLRN